ncbi:MAG: hypothetical protein ACE5HV_10320 [Acidobacteriota bacterium]
MVRRTSLIFAIALAAATIRPGPIEGRASPADALEPEQLLCLREAFGLVSALGNDVWPGWADVPLTTLIVGKEYEFLVNAPPTWHPAPDFSPTEQTFLGRRIYRRPRTLPSALRAAFPVDGLPAAVTGAWSARVESPNEWAITLIHEWFHVLQMDRDEAKKVGDLALGGPTYSSLQLDYPFAYGDADIGHAIHLLGQALYDFWNRSRTLPRAVQRTFLAETSWAALENLKTVVTLKYGEAAYNYFRYQTWKEGVARYSQVRISRLAAGKDHHQHFRHVAGFDGLQGEMSYSRLWDEVMLSNYWLIRSSVGTEGGDPTSFYGIGHGLAELLDAINPDWKDRYFEPGVWLDDLVAEVMDPEGAKEP